MRWSDVAHTHRRWHTLALSTPKAYMQVCSPFHLTTPSTLGSCPCNPCNPCTPSTTQHSHRGLAPTPSTNLSSSLCRGLRTGLCGGPRGGAFICCQASPLNRFPLPPPRRPRLLVSADASWPKPLHTSVAGVLEGSEPS